MGGKRTCVEKGKRDDDILKSQYEILGNINEKCIPLEEAENTLETIGRLTPYSNADGYYTYYPYLIDDIDLESLDKMRDEDRIRIVGNANPKKGGLKGIELRNKIVQEFENSNIAGICDRWDVKSNAFIHGGKEREKSISSSKR